MSFKRVKNVEMKVLYFHLVCLKLKNLSYPCTALIHVEHKHDVIYHGKCPAENCVDDYIGETARGVNDRIADHSGRDITSHLLKRSIESGHKRLEAVDYKIIGTGYRKNTMKRKLPEALFIKELKPTLNKQEKSVPLKLFN